MRHNTPTRENFLAVVRVFQGTNMMRIYERDTDALFLRLLRSKRDFHKLLSNLVVKKAVIGTPQIKGQRRHLVGTGSIDIVIDYPGGPLLLLENKIDAGYSVTRTGQGQPERYQQTVAAFRAQGREAYSVLLAPERYIASSRHAAMFDQKLSYESLCQFVAGKDLALLQAGIQQAETPYEPIPNEGAKNFFTSFRRLVLQHYPDLVMKHDPNPGGIRPADSRTIYFDVPRTLKSHANVPRPRMSLQCWDSNAPAASVKIMIASLAGLASRLSIPQDLDDAGGYLRPAGRSLGIVIDTPRLDTQKSLEDQIEDVIDGLESALRLQRWWNTNPDVLRSWAALYAVK